MRGKGKKANCSYSVYRITPAYAGKSPRKKWQRSRIWDHPRLCGEKFFRFFQCVLCGGSPPAYAGKSVLQLCQRHEHRDHPRLCGEKESVLGVSVPDKGSPPPMRGKAHGCHLFPPLFGITPAYAGKRIKRLAVKSTAWDHPRLCGEKFNQLFNVMCTIGSPPPMRGKVKTGNVIRIFCRITPAYAGKRFLICLHRHFKTDHPRLCGEKR